MSTGVIPSGKILIATQPGSLGSLLFEGGEGPLQEIECTAQLG